MSGRGGKGGKAGSSKSRKRKESGPMTAAGLVAFYQSYKGKIEISPTTMIIASAVLAATVVVLRLLVH